MPADEAQIFAADELATRGWGFNKELKVSQAISSAGRKPHKQCWELAAAFSEYKQALLLIYDLSGRIPVTTQFG